MLGEWFLPIESWFGLPIVTIILIVILIILIIKD